MLNKKLISQNVKEESDNTWKLSSRVGGVQGEEEKEGIVKVSSFPIRMNRKNVVHKNQKAGRSIWYGCRAKDNGTWKLWH